MRTVSKTYQHARCNDCGHEFVTDETNNAKLECPECKKNMSFSLRSLSLDMEGNDQGRKQFVQNLFDRGLISKATLVECFGFDAKKEQTALQEEAKAMADVPSQPGNMDYQNINRDAVGITSIRVEQARRNVEALGRLRDWGLTEVEGALKKNIEIMSEVEKIK